VIEHMAEYRAITSMLGTRGSKVAMGRLHDVLVDLLRDHLLAGAPGAPRAPLEVTIEFAVTSLLGLTEWWLDHGRPFPPEELDEMYRRLSEPGIRAALRPA
jgi:hypothetical protein